jgi:hypothetical protein
VNPLTGSKEPVSFNPQRYGEITMRTDTVAKSSVHVPTTSSSVLFDNQVVLATSEKGKLVPRKFANPFEASLIATALGNGHDVAMHPSGGIYVVKLS